MDASGDGFNPDTDGDVAVEESSNGKRRKFYIKPGIEWILTKIQLMRPIF